MDFLPNDGSALVKFNVRVDNFQMYTGISRAHWMNSLGVVGGIYGFYASIVGVLVGYFSEFDYRTTVIKRLFLER